MKNKTLHQTLTIFILTFISIECIADTCFQHFLDKWRQRNYVTSVIVAIENLKDNNIIYYSSGFVTKKKRKKATENNLYGVGSISKTFASAELLKLQQQNKVNLDDPIIRYFPKYKRWNKITIRQLLNMTSGI